MYGFIHCCLEDMVLQLFGEAAWREILNLSGVKLRGASFLMHQVYDDEMTFKLVSAASTVSGLPVEVCLEEFGKHFLVYCQKNGYDQILRVLGSNLYDFLTNLDNLHDHLASIYPGMRAPSFRVTRHLHTNRSAVTGNEKQVSASGESKKTEEELEENQMYLHYYSERVGLSPIVKGLVMAVAREFFQAHISVSVCQTAAPRGGAGGAPKMDKEAQGEKDDGQGGARGEPADDKDKEEADHVVLRIEATGGRRKSTTTAGTANSESNSQATAATQSADQSKWQQQQMLTIYDSLSSDARDSIVNGELMMQTFPFHVIFDRHFRLVQVGKSLLRLTSQYWREQGESEEEVKFGHLFRIQRPKVELTFDAIADHTNQVFVVRTRPRVLNADRLAATTSGGCQQASVNPTARRPSPPQCPMDRIARQRRSRHQLELGQPAPSDPPMEESIIKEEEPPEAKENQQQLQEELGHVSLRLKGQMIILLGGQLCLYLCSPRVDHLGQLLECGVWMSDFALHDRARELMLMSHTHKEDREAVKKLDQASNDLKKMDTKLRAENKRTEEVLHNIFPAKIATLLSHGHQVESESFELVTCLYSDIIGFTRMCGSENVRPIDIVRLLNTLYLQFDNLTNIRGVFKVETIGDAYVVVGGLPEPLEDHADRCVRMGLDMVKVISTVRSPADNQPIQMRIGIHSGPVMAGIVGIRVPRYSLFGNTTTLANQLETHGVGGKIHVSEFTLSKLIERDRFVVEDNPSRPANLPFVTYYVTDYLGDQHETEQHERQLEEQLLKDLELMGNAELELVDESSSNCKRDAEPPLIPAAINDQKLLLMDLEAGPTRPQPTQPPPEDDEAARLASSIIADALEQVAAAAAQTSSTTTSGPDQPLRRPLFLFMAQQRQPPRGRRKRRHCANESPLPPPEVHDDDEPRAACRCGSGPTSRLATASAKRASDRLGDPLELAPGERLIGAERRLLEWFRRQVAGLPPPGDLEEEELEEDLEEEAELPPCQRRPLSIELLLEELQEERRLLAGRQHQHHQHHQQPPMTMMQPAAATTTTTNGKTIGARRAPSAELDIQRIKRMDTLKCHKLRRQRQQAAGQEEPEAALSSACPSPSQQPPPPPPSQLARPAAPAAAAAAASAAAGTPILVEEAEAEEMEATAAAIATTTVEGADNSRADRRKKRFARALGRPFVALANQLQSPRRTKPAQAAVAAAAAAPSRGCSSCLSASASGQSLA